MKISYNKKWDQYGTVYDQGIRITKDQFTDITRAVVIERRLGFPRKDEYVHTSGGEIFLHEFIGGDGRVFFLTHTQTRFINVYLKLRLKDRNTYFLIDK